jgi:hypothetical protein
LIGHRAGGDVVILGRQAEQLISNAATGPERFESGRAEVLDDFQSERALANGVGHVENGTLDNWSLK